MKGRAFVTLCLWVVLLLSSCAGPAPGTPPAPTEGQAGAATPTRESGATPQSTLSQAPAPTERGAPSPTPSAAPTATGTPTAVPAARLDGVAFDTLRDGNAEIYLLDAEPGTLTNLTRHPLEDRAPAWRADGGALAFESNRDGNWEIYTLDLASGAVTRLTHEPAFDGAPAWSPDGARIAFESYRDGNLEVYSMAADGTDLLRLTESAAGDYGPAWSPDGETIAFASWRDGNKEVYLVPAAGGQARNLTEHPADDEDPAWGPDSRTIAFVSWRDVSQGGNRNAEIYQVSADGSQLRRVTDNLWPDGDPAFDPTGQLVWAAYDPGPRFETYDPYRPGDYHLYRLKDGTAERLTGTAWDDRRPAPAPAEGLDLARLGGGLPSLPAAATPEPALAAGTLASVVEVPGVLAGKEGPPVLVNELVVPSLAAWRQEVLERSGRDFLHETLGSWRPIDSVRKRAMYVYDYGFLSWHKTGRALDLGLEYKVEGADQVVLVREDLGEGVFWRLYLRAAEQDGSQGEPLRENPWLRWWWIVPAEDPEAYEAGGKRLPIPSGYYVDLTALAKRHGWERIASYAIEGDYSWLTDTNGTEYWHYERTDGLSWWQAMSQIYEADTLGAEVGWAIGLERAQTEEMMRSKGVPTPAP